MNGRAASLLLVLLAACATEPPVGSPLPAAAANVVIHVGGDGFVTVDGRRIPLDAIVLELRQRTRAMSAEERERFAVRLLVDGHPEGSDAARIASHGIDRLLRELNVMEVAQVVLL